MRISTVHNKFYGQVGFEIWMLASWMNETDACRVMPVMWLAKVGIHCFFCTDWNPAVLSKGWKPMLGAVTFIVIDRLSFTLYEVTKNSVMCRWRNAERGPRSKSFIYLQSLLKNGIAARNLFAFDPFTSEKFRVFATTFVNHLWISHIIWHRSSSRNGNTCLSYSGI